jgi:hypothetical protein
MVAIRSNEQTNKRYFSDHWQMGQETDLTLLALELKMS